jgi:putative ABC transport system permease protein
MLKLLRRIKYFLQQRRIDIDLEQEVEFHRALQAERFERDGLDRAAAHDLSVRTMGNVTLAREDARQVWIGLALDRLWQDVRYATRSLRRNAFFASVAVLTLALGIGASAAMFSVIDAILLRPLPYADADRLVLIWTADPVQNIHEGATSYLTLSDWRNENETFTDLAFWRERAGNITNGGEPERVVGALASANLFQLLGISAEVGRTFTVDEERERAAVVVLSHRLWQRRFGGDPGTIGETLEIDGRPLRIIGVMPERFHFPTKDVQHWEPATLMSTWSAKPVVADRSWGNRHEELWRVVGRLAPGARVRDAQARMDAIGRRLGEAYPSSDPDFIGYQTEIVPLLQQVTGRNLRIALWTLLGSVGMVLLIACANVSNLVLARGASRARELGVRTALGAGRGRLIQQLLIENGVIASVAGVLGSLAAMAVVRVIAASATPIPRLDEVRIDSIVLAFMVTVSVVAGLLFGVMPAWKLSVGGPMGALKEGDVDGRPASRARSMLVVVECALAVTLLVGAGLLMRSLLIVRSVDAGFATTNVLVARVHLPIPVSREWRRQEWETFAELMRRLEVLPGVRSAGAITNLMTFDNPEEAITVEGRPVVADRKDSILINTEDVTPEFFRALGVPLLSGRFFTHAEQNAQIALVNESFARRFVPGIDPLGKRFKEGGPERKDAWITIVGVVGDMHRHGLETSPVPEFFFPSTEPTMDVVIRTTANPASLAPSIREAIRSTYASAIVLKMQTVDEMFGDLTAQRRLQAWLMVAFAGVALLLSAVGIYAILHFSVSQRRREFGVRLALGATRQDLFRLIVGQGLRLPAIGVTAGLCGAYVVTRVIEHLLFQVSPTDPVTFAGVAVLLMAVALAASWIPARRATRIDPIAVLRCE